MLPLVPAVAGVVTWALAWCPGEPFITSTVDGSLPPHEYLGSPGSHPCYSTVNHSTSSTVRNLRGPCGAVRIAKRGDQSGRLEPDGVRARQSLPPEDGLGRSLSHWQ